VILRENLWLSVIALALLILAMVFTIGVIAPG
jgi:hypothetical protein